jgi:hypothetical protein
LNLDFLRKVEVPGVPDFGTKLGEALDSIARQTNTLEQQGNMNANGQPAAPPAIQSVKVTGQNGHFDISISDPSAIYRGIQYFAEHADNPHFTNSITIPMKDSRNANIFLGNVTRYWRAYSSYASSPPSAPAYHGGAAQPIGVSGGGAIGGPAFQASQGSGTGAPGVGLSGPGPVPARSATTAAPVRGLAPQ